MAGNMFIRRGSPFGSPPQKQDEIDKEFWEEKFAYQKVLKKGDSFTLDTLTAHRFTSNTSYPCDFVEFSTHHEDSDSYRIIKGD